MINRLINDPENVMDEMLNGYLKCYSTQFEKLENHNVMIQKNTEDRVSVVIGAGGGNEPWPIGYVGEGLADACAIGNVFTAPPARAILNMIKSVPNQKGVLCIATNHAGDVLNFELVAELAEQEGIETKRIYVADDITSAPKQEKDERRGIAGVSLVVKIASAAAKAGMNLEETAAVAQLASDHLHTCSVTTSPAYVLETGKEAYDLPEGKIEYGMGFNGEMGIRREDLTDGNKVTEEVVTMLLEDMELTAGEEIAVFLNPYKATTEIESYIIVNRCLKLLEEKQIKVHDVFVKSLFPTQGAGGFSISFLRMKEEYKDLYDEPAFSPMFQKQAGGWR